MVFIQHCILYRLNQEDEDEILSSPPLFPTTLPFLSFLLSFMTHNIPFLHLYDIALIHFVLLAVTCLLLCSTTPYLYTCTHTKLLIHETNNIQVYIQIKIRNRAIDTDSILVYIIKELGETNMSQSVAKIYHQHLYHAALLLQLIHYT